MCCGDHRSFYEQGFPATQLFERNGPIADPMYHSSEDLSDRPGFDFEQVRLITKAEVKFLFSCPFVQFIISLRFIVCCVIA